MVYDFAWLSLKICASSHHIAVIDRVWSATELSQHTTKFNSKWVVCMRFCILPTHSTAQQSKAMCTMYILPVKIETIRIHIDGKRKCSGVNSIYIYSENQEDDLSNDNKAKRKQIYGKNTNSIKLFSHET